MKQDNDSEPAATSPGSKTITLCGVAGCCPTVTFELDGSVVIKDDFGGKVTLNTAQFAALKSTDPASTTT